jgi:hypothetical protein
MPLARRTMLVLCLIAIATLRFGNPHARGETAKNHSPIPCGQACSCLPHTGCARCRTMRPIWCPDDYCPKCSPCVGPPRYCGRCDCYRAKCAPCIRPPNDCGTCDCYDAKCPPCLKIPCRFPSFYKCPPPKCYDSPAAPIDFHKNTTSCDENVACREEVRLQQPN